MRRPWLVLMLALLAFVSFSPPPVLAHVGDCARMVTANMPALALEGGVSISVIQAATPVVKILIHDPVMTVAPLTSSAFVAGSHFNLDLAGIPGVRSDSAGASPRLPSGIEAVVNRATALPIVSLAPRPNLRV